MTYVTALKGEKGDRGETGSPGTPVSCDIKQPVHFKHLYRESKVYKELPDYQEQWELR